MALSLQTRVAFDALIVTVVTPELTPSGYRKRGLRWTRSHDEIKYTIRLERERHGRWLDEVCFTFGFDVRTPEVSLGGRVGALMPEPDDVWWQVRAGVLRRKTVLASLEPDLVEHEIADAVGRVVETIHALTSTAAVRSFAATNAASIENGLLHVGDSR